METAISLPNDLFEAFERLVQRSRRRRDEVYADALREYVARHLTEDVTAALNAVVEEAVSPKGDVDFVQAAARRVLAESEW